MKITKLLTSFICLPVAVTASIFAPVSCGGKHKDPNPVDTKIVANIFETDASKKSYIRSEKLSLSKDKVYSLEIYFTDWTAKFEIDTPVGISIEGESSPSTYIEVQREINFCWGETSLNHVERATDLLPGQAKYGWNDTTSGTYIVAKGNDITKELKISFDFKPEKDAENVCIYCSYWSQNQ